MGARQGFPAHAAPGSVVGRADDCWHCLSVEGPWGCPARQEWQWWEGRLPSLSTPDLTRPHQDSRVPKQPLPCLALKTWKVWGLKDMKKTKFCKAIIFQLKKKRLKKKHKEQQRWGLHSQSASARFRLCLHIRPKCWCSYPISQTRIETQRLNILPQLTQLLRAGLRTGPLWSNLESRRCDDAEGAAETGRPMLSQAHTRTHTYMHEAFTLWLQKSEETRGQAGDSKGESRSIRRRSHTSQEAGEFLSLVSLSQTLDSSPWTQELTWLQNYAFRGVQLTLGLTAVSNKGGMST